MRKKRPEKLNPWAENASARNILTKRPSIRIHDLKNGARVHSATAEALHNPSPLVTFSVRALVARLRVSVMGRVAAPMMALMPGIPTPGATGTALTAAMMSDSWSPRAWAWPMVRRMATTDGPCERWSAGGEARSTRERRQSQTL